MSGTESYNVLQTLPTFHFGIFTVFLTELKMTEWKTTVHILSSSQSSIAVQQKIVCAADSQEWRRRRGGGEW